MKSFVLVERVWINNSSQLLSSHHTLLPHETAAAHQQPTSTTVNNFCNVRIGEHSPKSLLNYCTGSAPSSTRTAFVLTQLLLLDAHRQQRRCTPSVVRSFEGFAIHGRSQMIPNRSRTCRLKMLRVFVWGNCDSPTPTKRVAD